MKLTMVLNLFFKKILVLESHARPIEMEFWASDVFKSFTDYPNTQYEGEPLS